MTDRWREPARDWSAIDKQTGLPTNDQVERLACAIDQEHNRRRQTEGAVGDHIASHRVVGLYGERHIARMLKLQMDLAIRPYGSKRKNLALSDGTVIDVVTRQILRNGDYPDVIRKVNARGKVNALILVVWHGKDYEPEVPGFIFEPDLVDLNRIREFRDGHPNYTAPVGLLDPIWKLVERHDPDNLYADPAMDNYLTACRDTEDDDDPEPEPTDYQLPLF